jgi:hypothetical protein
MVRVNMWWKRIKEKGWIGGEKKMQMVEEGRESEDEITPDLFSQRELHI